MGFNLFLQNKNGKRFDINNIKDNIKREDYENDNNLQAIFDIFDIDETKDGVISSSNKQGKNELQSIFQKLSSADENGNGVIDDNEATNFIKKFLPDKNITSEDLFKFLSSLIKTNPEDTVQITKKDKDYTYTVVLNSNSANEGRLEWQGDSLMQIRRKYPDAHTPYLKDGVVIILDRNGKPVLDESGNPLKIEYIEKQKIFSEELAEINVLGHKATPMERLMHQAEILKELERLNNLETPEENYTELMRSIAFEKMSKKEQTEALLKMTGEKFYEAKERGDIAMMKEYLLQGFALAFQKMDMASIGGTNISIEGFKDFLKTWSGLNLAVEKLDKLIDDNNDKNITSAEKVWAFTKGIGDSVDQFIGTQGIAFMGALALATEAAAAGGIGELWAVAAQAYFAWEGMDSVAEGVTQLSHADSEEEIRQAGNMVGTGAIMMTGAIKSFKGVLTGKLQAGLKVKEALEEIKETKSLDEIKELQDNLSDLPYTEQEKQILQVECLKQTMQLQKENFGTLEGFKNQLNLEKLSYEIYTDKEGNTIIRIVASAERKDVSSGVKFTYDCYKYDKEGNIVELKENITEKDFKSCFGKIKQKEIIDNTEGKSSGHVNMSIPIPSYIRNKFNTVFRNITEPVQLERQQFNVFSDTSKSVDDIMYRIKYVCDKYGYHYKSIVNNFMKGLDVNLKIFDSEQTLNKYIKDCIKLCTAKDKHGLPAYNKHLYNFDKDYIDHSQIDMGLVKDIALLSATDPKMANILDRVCYVYENGNIDQFSLCKIIKYLQEGYISPETLLICLETRLINKGHIDLGNIVDAKTSSNKLIIQAREKVLDTMSRINPQLQQMIAELKTEIGNDIYRIKWDCLNLQSLDINGLKAFVSDARNLIHLKNIELSPENFYIKIDGYGKDEKWAREMVDITEHASKKISEGSSSDEVLSFLASETRSLSLSGKYNKGRATSQGVLRTAREGYMYDNSTSELGAITGFESNQYSSYAERFRAVAQKPLTNPYQGQFDLTRISLGEEYPISAKDYDPNNPKHGYTVDINGNKQYYELTDSMVHPHGKYVSKALDIVKEQQDFLIQKYKGKPLSKQDLDDINETIGEIHWILSHSMPWGRGSAGISQAYVLSIYQTLGLKVSPPKDGISFDLEAFCTELSDYKKNYKFYYEQEPEIAR